MPSKEVHVVTGAFGYSGKYITNHLLQDGYKIRTLTNSTNRLTHFRDKIDIHPYNFDNKKKMVESLTGATVLYNTYWVRFNHTNFKQSVAVENTIKLFNAAKEAGIKRIVHVSILNPSESSPLEYFSSKAKLERILMELGVSYAILRPAVLFGREDILINNIAWFLRNFPIFGILGDGSYKIQPIYVDDLANLAIEQGRLTNNCIINAIGPETFTYRELVETISRIIKKRKTIISMPPILGYWFASIVGKMVGDVVITWEEVLGLMDNLLYVDTTPTGWTKLTQWAQENVDILGIKYASEIKRRIDRTLDYGRL